MVENFPECNYLFSTNKDINSELANIVIPKIIKKLNKIKSVISLKRFDSQKIEKKLIILLTEEIT